VLINEFEYDMNEDIKPLECDIWKIC
jgi:hypothetical protein